MDKPLTLTRPVSASLYTAVSVFTLALFLKNAWVAEDAFIILRSVEQFLAGNGFRWNPHERVQVFTSPLWYLLVIASTAVSQTLYLNLLTLSLLLLAALLWVMARLFPDARRWAATVLLLTLSQAFFDYTASGLEYPLAYLLVAGFVLLYLRDTPVADHHRLAACAGLALVTRHDLLCLLFPMLLHLGWQWQQALNRRQWITVLALLLGPLLLWTLFSLFYYGLPLPNTAYAKLGIDGVSRLERVQRGLIYLSVSLKIDPITPLLIGLALWRGLLAGGNSRGLALGLLTALAYITWIGADYMMGRFYAPLYLAAVLLLCRLPVLWSLHHRPSAMLLAAVTTFLIGQLMATNLETAAMLFPMAGIAVPTPGILVAVFTTIGLLLAMSCALWAPARKATAVLCGTLLFASTQQLDGPWQTAWRHWGKSTDFDMWWNLNNVSRERYFIYHWTSLYAWWHRDPARPFPDHPWCHEGLAAARVAVVPFAGMTPYCMGIDRIAIDIKALTDPLLTRLPKSPDAIWSSGGVNRHLPPGYVESVQAGTNQIPDPDLARYYDQLRLITSNDSLLAPGRLAAIIDLNLGRYQPWLDAYRSRLAAQAATD